MPRLTRLFRWVNASGQGSSPPCPPVTIQAASGFSCRYWAAFSTRPARLTPMRSALYTWAPSTITGVLAGAGRFWAESISPVRYPAQHSPRQ